MEDMRNHGPSLVESSTKVIDSLHNRPLLVAADRYLDLGQTLIVIGSKSKKPADPLTGRTLGKEEDWFKINTKAGIKAVVEGIVKFDLNLAIFWGEGDRPMNEVDLDSPVSRELAPYYLPHTAAIYGRSGSRKSQYVYSLNQGGKGKGRPKIPERGKYIQFLDPDAKTMLHELRGHGVYTVVPVSTHESGEKIEWGSNHELRQASTVTREELERACGMLAAATLLAGCYGEKMKNVLSGAIAAMLGKSGWDRADVVQFMWPIMQISGDTDIPNRIDYIDRTFEKINNGEPVQGSTLLAAYLSPAAMASLHKWLRSDDTDAADEAVIELNRTYAQIVCRPNMGGVTDLMDPWKPAIVSVPALHAAMAGETVTLMIGGKKIEKAKTALWAVSKQRRKINGLAFEPTGSLHPVPEGYYNCWQGLAIEPGDGNAHEPLLAHIRDHITQNDKDHHWFMTWSAALVQVPGRKSKTSTTIKGDQGSGKTVLGDYFCAIFGPAAIKVANPRIIAGQFNDAIQNRVLVIFQEGIWSTKSADTQCGLKNHR